MRIAGVVPTSVISGGLLVLSSGGFSSAQPVQTDAGVFAPTGDCIQITRNLVGIVTVASVRNKCDEPFTVVIYTTQGSKVINASSHFEATLNTTLFSRWKVCQGVSNPAC